jgi:hypothetical protein
MLLPGDLGLFTLDKLGVARSTLYDWCPSLNGLRQMKKLLNGKISARANSFLRGLLRNQLM